MTQQNSNMDKLTEKILALGVKNCFFYGSLFDDDEGNEILLKIDEARHKVAENYKITLAAVSDNTGTRYQHFYIGDLQKLIKEGHFIFLVKDSTFNK